jgi:hypothetical protein
MTHNLTKIAALPGSGAGCMASLPAEKNEQPVKVQMKAPYFEEPDNIWSAIDWTGFDLSGGFGC